MKSPRIQPNALNGVAARENASMDHDSKLEMRVSTGILPAETDVRAAVPRAGVSSPDTLPI
jgi:hypothetical protein